MATAAASCSCSLQCQPWRVNVLAEATAAGRSSVTEQQQHFKPRNLGGGAFASRRIGNVVIVGQKEHLGRSLRLPERQQQQQYGKAFPGLVVEAAKRVNSGKSFALSSTLVVAEDKLDEAKALCQEILKWGETKTKVRGSGVQIFECNVDPYETSTYHFWELYDSFLVMNDVRSSPEHTKFMNDVRPFLVQPIGLAAYEYKDGQIGHMLNPIGPKGEGGLDDATGQSGTKQQSSSIGQGLGEMEEDMGSKAWGLDKLLAKVRGEDKESGWSFKTLFGDAEAKAKK
ncbi:unnamed protein product [Calypogeia fissa]